jgi:uncharacterized membrane protein
MTFVFLISLIVITNKQSRARWLLDYPSFQSLCLISLGLGLGSLSIGLGLVKESFAIIMTRNVLDLASRVMLTIGMVGSYYPLTAVERSRPTSSRHRSTVEAKPQRPIRPSAVPIGAPITGSFVKMDVSATRSFHHERLGRTSGHASASLSTPHHDRVISRHVRHWRGWIKLILVPESWTDSVIHSLDIRSR